MSLLACEPLQPNRHLQSAVAPVRSQAPGDRFATLENQRQSCSQYQTLMAAKSLRREGEAANPAVLANRAYWVQSRRSHLPGSSEGLGRLAWPMRTGFHKARRSASDCMDMGTDALSQDKPGCLGGSLDSPQLPPGHARGTGEKRRATTRLESEFSRGYALPRLPDMATLRSILLPRIMPDQTKSTETSPKPSNDETTRCWLSTKIRPVVLPVVTIWPARRCSPN